MGEIRESVVSSADGSSERWYEQDYEVPVWWVAAALTVTASAHGAVFRDRRLADGKQEIIVTARDPKVLRAIDNDVFRLFAPLEDEIKAAVKRFCARIPSMITKPSP